MEHTLRCNVLKCRKELSDHAVVTTCSHIFCIECSNACQLSSQREGQHPVCPACDMHLTNPDDVVVTNLNPTEDYKTSVLSGLNPGVIMECASRALGFWAYQTAQEIVYQEYLAKNLTEKYTTLNTQMDKVIHDANGEINNIRSKMSNMHIDYDNLGRKHEEVVQALKEKTRKHLQTQELYDKLKRRAMLGQVQNAASDAVDHTIQASVASERFVDKIVQHQHQQPQNPPHFSNFQTIGMQPPISASMGNMGPPIGRPGNGDGRLGGISGQESIRQNQPVQTPSSHRQRLGPSHVSTTGIGLVNLQNKVASTPTLQRKVTPGRQPLSSLSGNNVNPSGFVGYGMSAGLKVSNPAGATGLARPSMRSRVAQRPGSGIQENRNSGFIPSSTPNLFTGGDSYY